MYMCVCVYEYKMLLGECRHYGASVSECNDEATFRTLSAVDGFM